MLLSVPLAGCPGKSEVNPEAIEVATVKVTGRVVDFETCFSAAGCQSVPNLIVSLYYNDLLRSSTTGADGAFELRWVPDTINSYLIVTEAATDQSAYLPTLQARPITTAGADIFGLELFVLPRRGGLYQGIVAEAETTAETQPLFIGQVFMTQGSSAMVTFAGAQVSSSPATTVRFIKSNPRFPEQWGDTTTLHPAEQTVTTAIGSFLAIGTPNMGEVTFTVSGPDVTFPPIKAPITAGFITIALIEGVAGAANPQPDGGAQ